MDRIAQGNASPCESSGVVNYRDLLWCIYDELSTCAFVQRGRGDIPDTTGDLHHIALQFSHSFAGLLHPIGTIYLKPG